MPEFAAAPVAVIQAALNAAALETPAIASNGLTCWGAQADEGQKWLAAMKLASQPFGQGVRLQPGASNAYATEYNRLRRQLGVFGATS